MVSQGAVLDGGLPFLIRALFCFFCKALDHRSRVFSGESGEKPLLAPSSLSAPVGWVAGARSRSSPTAAAGDL
jgi:hypothetical protein